MRIRTIAALSIGCVGLGTGALALADSPGRADPGPISWRVAGGYSAPTGQISDYLQGGYVLSGGFTYAPNGSRLGLRADASFSSHGATNNFLDYGAALTGVQVDSGAGQFFSFSLGPSYTVPFIGGSRAYVLAQVGLYYSSLQLTQTALFQGDFCDPYLGFCDYGVFPGDNLVYDDSQTRFGWNVGVGVEFPTYFGPTYFVEAGYHRLSGPQPIEYVPIEIGIRF
jgi:opacity protein-like surface antigen